MSEPFVLDFSVIFNDYMASNQKVWKHDRSQTLGASEVFRCNRQNWFEKFGGVQYQPDNAGQRWGATERGNIIENHFVVPALTNHLPNGVQLLYAGSDQDTLISGRNSATPDGLFTGIPPGDVTVRWKGENGVKEFTIRDVTSGCIGLEIKSIDPRAILTEERAKHRGQSQVGLGLIRELTEWQPDHWLILYVDASFLDTITPFLVYYDNNIFLAAKARAKALWNATDPLDLMPEGKFDGGCSLCRWTNACGEAILTDLSAHFDRELSDTAEAATLNTLLDSYNYAKAEAEAAAEVFEKRKHEIKEWMRTRSLSRTTTDRFKISWSKVKGRKTLDRAAVAAAGIDLTPFEVEGRGYDTLRITERSTK